MQKLGTRRGASPARTFGVHARRGCGYTTTGVRLAYADALPSDRGPLLGAKVMLCSLAEAAKVVTDYLPPQLASAEAVANVLTVTQAFPDALSYHFGFESRLGAQAPAIDFAMLITPTRGGREIVAGTH